MIIVVTTMETNEITGRKQLVASHGVDNRTGKVVILSSEPPEALGAVFDYKVMAWVIRD